MSSTAKAPAGAAPAKRNRAGSPTPLAQLAVPHGPRATDQIALTFDDGPAGGTVDALRVLERHRAKGTFFVVGRKIPGNEALLRRMVRAGHELGNHSFHHLKLPTSDDLRAASALIQSVVGSRPRSYRPPFGAIDQASSRAASELGMRSVRWDVDSEDVFPIWEGIPADKIYSNVVDLARPGSIVLLHDGCVWSKAVDALPAIVETLTARGFRLVTVSELFDDERTRRLGGHGSAPERSVRSGESRWRPRAWLRGPRTAETAAETEDHISEELAGMKPRHVIDLLERRRDERVESGLSARLARSFSDRVVDNPAAFAELSDRLIVLGPSVVLASLKGFERAVVKWRGVRWDGALAVIESTLPGAVPGQVARGGGAPASGYGAIDPWSRRLAAIALLEAGMRQGVIPANFAPRVWRALERLSWDSELTTSGESDAQASPEAVRAKAMHAVIQYAEWMRDTVESGELGIPPEVGRTLDAHLDPTLEDSTEVLAVYGQRAATLFTLDPGWFTDRLEIIFPLGDAGSPRGPAAWNAHLVWDTPTRELFELLEDRYRWAVARLPANRDESTHGASGNGLARHLDVLYRAEAIDLAEDGVLHQFVGRAAPGELEYLVSAVGLFLHRDDAGADPALQDRLMRLWEAIRFWTRDRDEGARRTALGRFGLWYAAGVLDQEWCDDQIAALLHEEVPVEPEFPVVEQFGRRTLENPRRGLDLTGLYVELVEDPWRLFSVRDGLRSVFDAGRSTEDDDLRRRVQEVERAAAAKGFPGFDELLSGAER